MNSYIIALLPGDGIGPELTKATLHVLEAIQKKFSLNLVIKEVEAGDGCLEKRGIALPEETIKVISTSDACLKGPVGETAADVIVKLRLLFDLFANIRPIKSYPSLPVMKPNIDFVIVRENTEDLYKGIEFLLDETAIGIRIITRKGSERIARKAFELAEKRSKRKVTSVHKSNVLKLTCGLFAESCRNIAKQYPTIEYEEQYVDATAMRLIREPENFDVIVTTNMFGDILSDEAAQLVGGLGMAPAANLGEDAAIFEPVHGSAPDIAGKNIANPCSMILSAKMMLDWLGEKDNDSRCIDAANSIEDGLVTALKKGNIPTDPKDFETMEIAYAISREILN
jgi:3-isopropylmalate dehydrogenase